MGLKQLCAGRPQMRRHFLGLAMLSPKLKFIFTIDKLLAYANNLLMFIFGICYK
ncbi:hypothetical protein AALB_3062 [Agarivorans albus MKT 106]|uniref:Uncharacterized protein n=1 Tax=Agarivorans albus MKT 106 TaxID=1331007 RepID=R9PNK8_AGAAL|nr:hypothetical protein AALB_3062 [Agarivorans albus MKT 106]